MTDNPVPLLEIRKLSVSYPSTGARRRVLDGVSLEVRSGEIYGLVGESGSGKTTLALAVLDLIPFPGLVEGGEVTFDGRALAVLLESELDTIRGGQIGLIFQNARTSLNPTFSIGAQIAEVLQVHAGLDRRAAVGRADQWLARVGLGGSARAYPHQLSGGQAQRAALALALAPGPRLLIADEPTSALDVTVQSHLMRLLRELTEMAGTAVLLITHDLGLIAQTAQRVGVLHTGRLVEQQTVEQLFAAPQHSYSQRLIESLPSTELWPGRQPAD